MNSDKDIKNLIHYFLREKYFQTVETLTLEGLKVHPDDSSFKLYNAFSLVLNGRLQECIRELQVLINLKDINIGATLALIAAHKLCKTIDKESVLTLENKLKADRKVTNDLSLYYGALFLFFNDKLSKSTEYVDKFLKIHPNSIEGLILKGWIEISNSKTSDFKLASQCFNAALDKDKKNIDAYLGLIKIKEKENDMSGAMTILNQLIVKYPNSLPPLIEKMKIQLVSNDWDLTVEVANRILLIDKNCIEAHKMKTLALICKKGNFTEAAYSLKQLYNEIGKSEKKNGKLYFTNAQLFSYISEKNPNILHETYSFAEKAAQIEPSNSDFLTELGYQNLLQKNLKEAVKFFKNSTKLDESSVSALTGLTLCQIEEGGLDDQIKQQVEFLREIQNEQQSSELLLMSAKLANTPGEAISYLNQCVQVHFNNFKKYPFGITYIYQMNPVFLMEVVHEYLKYAPSDTLINFNNNKIPDVFAKSIMILEELTNSCPGMVKAQFELANVLFSVGNLKKAKNTLNFILGKIFNLPFIYFK